MPNALPRPAGELPALEQAWQPPRGWRLASSVNNTHVGLFYIATALAFFVLAGALALVMRAQLAVPGNTLVSPALYNQLFTMHGTVMMFLFAVPVVEAVAVWLLPNMLGARDLPFPRLSAYAFWAYAFGGAAFFATIFFGVAPDGGWFMVPPLTAKTYSPGLGADFWLLGIGFIEISAIAGAVELIVGILMTRTPGMTLARMPVYAWAMLVVGFMIVFAFPAIIAGTALLELERAFGWPFFEPARGGDPLLWQHLFWFFGHPEVYIIFLPAAGLVSMLVPVLARTPLVGERAVVWALAAVGVVSFALWAHHMFTAGLSRWSLAVASAASLVVALPSTLQVFAWIATLGRGRLQRNVSAHFVLGFLALFVIGGLTGVMVAVLPFDTHVHDTYFVVAHLHYVLVGGLVFPLFAALYHWLPLVRGQALSERLGRWVFWLMFAGFNLAFLPMHASGLVGMPRRVASFDADPGWAGLDMLNALSSLGAFVLAAGVALCAVDLVRTLVRPRREPGDPWGAATLEWLPNGAYGARSLPQVTSARPLWDQPQLVHEVPAGGHWLPGTASGRREALVTTAAGARPRYLLVLPGDGWLPLVGAAGTAGFFLLLTVGATIAAWACGALAVAAVLAWLWRLDRDAGIAQAVIGRAGDGLVAVPVGGDAGAPHAAHAIWGFVIVLAVDATVFLSFLYAHVHVALAAEVCPPPGAALPPLPAAFAAFAAWAAAALAAEGAWRACVGGSGSRSGRTGRIGRTGRSGSSGSSGSGGSGGGGSKGSGSAGSAEGPAGRRAFIVGLAVAAAAALALLALFLQLQAQQAADLDPRRDAWSATVAALVAYDGLHAVVVAVIGAFVVARVVAGLLTRRHATPLAVLRLALWASAAQAAVTLVVSQQLPGWLA